MPIKTKQVGGGKERGYGQYVELTFRTLELEKQDCGKCLLSPINALSHIFRNLFSFIKFNKI